MTASVQWDCPCQAGLVCLLDRGSEVLFSHRVKGRLLLGKIWLPQQETWRQGEQLTSFRTCKCNCSFNLHSYLEERKALLHYSWESPATIAHPELQESQPSIGNVWVGSNLLLKVEGQLAVFTSHLAQWHHQMPGRYTSTGKSLRRPAPTRSQTLCKQNRMTTWQYPSLYSCSNNSSYLQTLPRV